MAGIDKPRFPEVTVRKLGGDLDKLEALVERSRAADGSVDVAKLERGAAGNAALEEAVRVIKGEDQFLRPETRRVRSACGGGMEERNYRVAPKTLAPDEVRTVLDALRDAHRDLGRADANQNHLIDPFEKDDVGDRGLGGDLAKGVLKVSLQDYTAALRTWRRAINDAVDSLEDRESMLGSIDRMASFHAASPTAEKAIAWHFKALATGDQGRFDYWDAKDQLEQAEKSFLRFLPRFMRPAHADNRAEDHLSDREVKKLLQTDDLAEHAAQMQARATQNVGGDWAAYTKGADIAGLDQRNDADFRRVRSAC